MSFNVLISSGGRRVALVDAFRKDLAQLGLEGRLLVADMSDQSAAWHSADEAFLVPPCSSPDFLPTMLAICEREEVRLLVPTIDPELAVYAAARDRFAAIGTTVHISSPEVIAIGGDKVTTHRWLQEAGLPTVRQGLPSEVLADPEDWPWPLLVKPIHGSSSRGVAVVADTQALEAATRDEAYIVQTIAPGEEYTVSCYVDRSGETRCTVPRKRIETRAGEVSKGMTCRSAPLEELATRSCAALPGAWGAMNLQVFLEPDSGELRIIELNPRFGGGYPLAWEAGAHYPRWIIEEILELPSTARSDAWTDGLVMLRWDAAVFVNKSELGGER